MDQIRKSLEYKEPQKPTPKPLPVLNKQLSPQNFSFPDKFKENSYKDDVKKRTLNNFFISNSINMGATINRCKFYQRPGVLKKSETNKELVTI